MAGFSTANEIHLTFNFPNIAHSYWENYRLTGEYYVAGPKLGRD